jgi:hypothetical protein
MHNKYFTPVLLLSLGAFIVSLAGCKKEETAAPAPAANPAPAPVATRTVTFKDLTFTVPTTWTDKLEDNGNQLDMVGPTASGWPTNISVRIIPNPQDLSAGEIAQDAMSRLSAKPDFANASRQSSRNPAGNEVVRVAYQSKNETGAFELGQWYFVIQLPNKRWAEVQANAAADVWDAQQPTIEQIVNSLQVKK